MGTQTPPGLDAIESLSLGPKNLNTETTSMLETFFFIIGGIQPRVTVLDEKPRRCPSCGLYQAYLKRVDHYVSIFFIPVFKVKTGEPVLVCERCERPASGFDSDSSQLRHAPGDAKSCRSCGKDFPMEYIFCPLCGRRL
jgi:hypothetical protein